MSTSSISKPSKANTSLRKHRKKQHWTQAELADQLYQLCQLGERERGVISVNMISGWERGRHQPSAFWLKKLCQLFKATPEALGLSDELSDLAISRDVPLQELSLHDRLSDYLRE